MRGSARGRATGSRSWPATERLLYRDVQALANRFANVYGALGLEPEQRVLVALPDVPEYVGALFGAFKAGAAAVMANPGLKPEEIAYFLDYTRARLAVVHRGSSRDLGRGRLGVALAQAAPRRRRRRRRRHPSPGLMGPRVLARVGPLRERPHPPRRRVPLALLGRHDGPAQGRPPVAPLVRQHHRALCQGHPRVPRVGRHPFGAQALLRLRHGLQPLLPLLGGRHRGPLPRAPHAGGALRADPPPSAHHPRERAHGGEPDGGARGRREAGPLLPPLRHLRRRGAAPGALSPLEGRLRRGAARRPRHRRDVAHLHHQPARRREARDHGARRGGVRRARVRRRRPRAARR